MKSNLTKKKLNKEKKSLKKKMCLVFHQHNIGCCEVQEKKEKDLYGQNIRYERQKKNIRNIENYLNKTKINADIITLQEVQENESNKNIKYKNKNYGIIYKKTGLIHYLTIDNNKSDIEDIEHGCAVIYNKDMFKLKDIFSDYIIPEKKNYLPRSTPWLILERKTDSKIFAVISLHGLIFDPPSDSRLVRNKYFYKNLTKSMKTISEKFNPNFFLIGTDLNTNLYNPRFNAFKNKENSYQKDLKKNSPIFKSYLNDFRKFLEKKNIISSIDNRICTNYNWNESKNIAFYDQIDFIFHSKELKNIKWNLNTKQYLGTKPESCKELEFLENDFDHLNIQITFQ